MDYSKSYETLSFIDEMVSKHKFEKSYLVEIFKNAEKREKIINSMNRPAEKKFSWVQYKSRLISPIRINNGVSFLQRFLPEFEKAEKEFGVPKEIIAAIIGIESSYGSITGRERVIDSLSTLAFDYPRRSKFFTKQLEHFLLLTREEKLDPLVMKGSYAGAMGAEALTKNDVNSNFKTSLSLKEPDALELASKINLPNKKYLQINFEDKEFWLGHKNLYVLSRYNRSSFYVMAVFLLSQEIDYAYRVKI